MADFQEINENEPAAENQEQPAAAEGDEANCSLANQRQDRNTPESGVVSDESSSSSGSETGRISYSFFIPSLTIDKTVGKDEDISVSNANRQQRQQNMINELKLRRQLEMKTREKPQPSVTESVTIEELRKRFNEQVCSLIHRNSSKGFGNHKSFLEPLEFPSPIAPVIHPSEFDPPNLSTTDRSEPEFGCDPLVVYFHSRLFLLDTWPRFAQSENPARREMAANNFLSIFHPKGPLSGNIEQLEEMFSLIENLLLDEALEVRRAAQKHIPRCAELCKAMAEEEPWFWDQFNHRIPAMLVRLLLEKLHNAPISLWTLEQLMEADLLKDEAVQNMVVPGLFCFLSQSNHFFTQYDRAMRPPKEKNYNVRLMSDDEEDEELKHILRLETLRTEMQVANSQATLNVFRILNSILAKATDKLLLSADGGSSSTTANCAAQMDWVRSQLVPQMADFFSAEQRLFWQRDIREQMANSLAPLAHWMGREGADTKLLPIFQLFMQHDAVQCSAIKHLAAFCQILSEDCREILVRELSQLVILNADTRWRQRAEFAEQLSHLVPLFPAQSVNKYLSAFALTFSADRISEVRNKGIGMLAAVLGAFIRMEWTNSDQDNNKTNSSTGDEEVVQAEMDNANAPTGTVTTAAAKSSTSTESTLTSTVTASQAEPPPSLPLTDKLLAEIRSGFWRTRNWRRRQSFGRLLYLLVQRRLLSDEHFYLLFIHDFISLSDDDVSNVRQYFYLLAQLNQFEMFGNGVRNRLETMAVQDSDLENRTLAKIALGELDPSEDGLDLSGRAVGLTN